MKTINPPQSIETAMQNIVKGGPTLFLAGSIEMGQAEEWQNKVITNLNALEIDGLIMNPRRADWDASWEQSIGNPKFKEQVDWELNGILAADVVAFYFDPKTKSPITLFELGLAAGNHKDCVVYCPEPFWRKGNVDIYCQRFDLQQVTTFDEFLYEIKKRLVKS